ncbi:hypothetical protein [Leuconostoc pseudomesenteroides]|uniref:hypothetical protein n=1 Tax=Leuconostoc pseudomesenteroides TaxID=33968 RepID=UPI0040369471
MTNEPIQSITISYFSWSVEQSEGGNEHEISEFSSNDSGEIDLSDDEALGLSTFILQELGKGKHITFRTIK